MKYLLGFIVVFALVQNSFASPLIFKAVKEIPEKARVEIGVIDTSKYNKLRIKVQNVDERYKENSEYREFDVSIYAVEDKDVFIDSIKGYIVASKIVEIPSQKTKIVIEGRGKFEVYVWATQ